VLTDIHERVQAAPVAEVVNVMQIPGLYSAAQSDLTDTRPLRPPAAPDKGELQRQERSSFSLPGSMAQVWRKLRQAGAPEIWLTERGKQLWLTTPWVWIFPQPAPASGIWAVR